MVPCWLPLKMSGLVFFAGSVGCLLKQCWFILQQIQVWDDVENKYIQVGDDVLPISVVICVKPWKPPRR